MLSSIWVLIGDNCASIVTSIILIDKFSLTSGPFVASAFTINPSNKHVNLNRSIQTINDSLY